MGLHFFSPANVTKLLEIVRGAKTAKDVIATSMAVAKQIKKIGVVAGVCDGFIGNRMLDAYLRQMGLLLDAGALPQQIDRALEKFGFAMGPFRVSDLAGNDIGWAIRKRLYVEHPERVYSKIPDRICELERFGQKTGAGWYDYKPGDRSANPSELVAQIILEESTRLGQRRKVSDQEIVERALYSLINEGARILEEGIALRASDIDVVYLAGYGFPDFRGGPLHYADTVGLPNILRTMRAFAKGYQPDAWVPAPLLDKIGARESKLRQLKVTNHDRRRCRFDRPHRTCQVLARLAQHDPSGDLYRPRAAPCHRAGAHRSGRSRRRHRRRDLPGRSGRHERGAAGGAARRLSGHHGGDLHQPLLFLGAAIDRARGAAHHGGRGRDLCGRRAWNRSPASRTRRMRACSRSSG